MKNQNKKTTLKYWKEKVTKKATKKVCPACYKETYYHAKGEHGLRFCKQCYAEQKVSENKRWVE